MLHKLRIPHEGRPGKLGNPPGFMLSSIRTKNQLRGARGAVLRPRRGNLCAGGGPARVVEFLGPVVVHFFAQNQEIRLDTGPHAALPNAVPFWNGVGFAVESIGGGPPTSASEAFFVPGGFQERVKYRPCLAFPLKPPGYLKAVWRDFPFATIRL